MPIGTSTGSYYDDNFHAEAGIDTSADEEASANPEVNTDLGLKAGTKETFPTQKDISSVSTDLDKAMSLGMGFAGGGLGRLLYNPITGEAHTTADAIEHLWPVVKNLVNKIPIRIHFGDDVPAEKITDQSPSVEDVFNQNHLWNQPSNIQGNVSRDVAYSSDPLQQSPQPLQPQAQALAESIRRPSRSQLNDIWAAEDARDAEKLKNAFADPDKLLQQRGDMKLVRKDITQEGWSGYPTHYFGFMGDDGIPHALNIAEKNGGKKLYVDWIGDPSFGAVNSLGSKNVRDLLRMVKDQFPKAEEIAGLRISGARGRNNGPENASMRLR